MEVNPHRSVTAPIPGSIRAVGARRATWVAGALALLVAGACARAASPVPAPAPAGERVVLEETAPAGGVTITNSYPFPIREAVRLPLAGAPGGESGGVWTVVSLRPGETRRYMGAEAAAVVPGVTVAERFASGLPATLRLPDGRDLPLFDLSLVETKERLEDFPERREQRIRELLSGDPRAMSFTPAAGPAAAGAGELRFRAEGGRLNRYEVAVTYRPFSSGMVDVEVEMRTVELRDTAAYLALAKHLPAAAGDAATLRWKGMVTTVPAGGASPPRTERGHSFGRDVSWVSVPGRGSAGGRALLARFVPGLTRMHRERLRNVNDFFVNEYLVGLESSWVLLSEVSREPGAGVATYLPRGFVVPTPEEPIRLEFRLLPPGDRRPEEMDQAFTSYAGYQAARRAGDEVWLDFGVSGVSFGTSYFPHSTFAENFDFFRTGGMSGRFRPVDQWWPTFEGWGLFREEIRRDMRIANAMGLEWIRIHHFDAPDFREDHLTTPAGRWMLEYIAFMAEVARETDQRLFLDFSLSPNDAGLLAERFGDVIGVWEMQNEVLIIPGASEDRYPYWREVRDRIRAARPDAIVLLTGGPQFYALYEPLARAGVVVDAVGQHAYVDARGMPDHFRDIAVSLGGYATRTGRVPLNSEYNWRMITRDTEEEQARRFEEISEHLLSPRNIPLLFQFQFQETFAVPPRTRGALRHYELLRVDRTPKPQALVYSDLIRRYGRADNRIRQLEVTVDEVSLEPGRSFGYAVRLRNLTERELELVVTPALPAGFLSDEEPIPLRLAPGETRVLARRATAPAGLAPGVHHFFARVVHGGRPHFGWGIGRYRAQPRLDLEAPLIPGVRYAGGLAALAEFDLASLTHVVFGAEAPSLEVDWALYLYHSLRAATGTDVRRAKDTDLGDAERRSRLVLVGSAESNPLVAAAASRLPGGLPPLAAGEGMIIPVDAAPGGDAVLLVTGGDAEGVQRAAADLLYRYWRHAPAAVSFREGMPPVDGEVAATAPPEPTTTGGSVALSGPATVRAGDAFRVIALDHSEPPRPLPGVELSVRLGGREVASGRSNASGEATFRLQAAGVYEIVAVGAAGRPLQVRVTEPGR